MLGTLAVVPSGLAATPSAAVQPAPEHATRAMVSNVRPLRGGLNHRTSNATLKRNPSWAEVLVGPPPMSSTERLGYYLGAWNGTEHAIVGASVLGTRLDIDKPFVFSGCDVERDEDGKVLCAPEAHGNCKNLYAEPFDDLLRETGLDGECFSFAVMWGDRSSSKLASDARTAALGAAWFTSPGAQEPVPLLVKTRARHSRWGIVLNLNAGRHFGFLREPVPSSALLPWSERKDALIWRGGPNDLRNAYCDALRDLESDGIDVELHLEGSDGEVPIEDMMKYRYLLSLEGNDVATDLKWKLASGSVVLMPAPTAESWLMEFGLQPGVHYQQVDGPSDVPAKLSWLRANPAAAEGIAREARQWMAHFIDAERELALSRDVLRRAAALVDAKRE